MQIIVCKRCKKIFQYMTGERVCQECKKKEEELFIKVKEYLRNNRGATVEELKEATGVSNKLIQKFLREGRLELTYNLDIELNCQRCGEKIYTGRYCKTCITKLNDEINEITSSMAPKSVETKPKKEKMHLQHNK